MLDDQVIVLVTFAPLIALWVYLLIKLLARLMN